MLPMNIPNTRIWLSFNMADVKYHAELPVMEIKPGRFDLATADARYHNVMQHVIAKSIYQFLSKPNGLNKGWQGVIGKVVMKHYAPTHITDTSLRFKLKVSRGPNWNMTKFLSPAALHTRLGRNQDPEQNFVVATIPKPVLEWIT